MATDEATARFIQREAIAGAMPQRERATPSDLEARDDAREREPREPAPGEANRLSDPKGRPFDRRDHAP